MKQSTQRMYEYYENKYGGFLSSFGNPKDAINILKDKQLSPSYIKAILSAHLHTILDDTIKNEYRKAINELRATTSTEELDHSKTHGYIPKWETIISKRDELKRNGDKVGYLLLSLYTVIPPRRLKDIQLLKFVDSMSETNDKSANYYVRNDKLFIFNVYKTAKTYGTQYIKSPVDLPPDASVPANVGYLLKKYIGCSVDNIRHSYVNHFYEKYNMPPSAEIEELSKNMGHCVETNLKYRKSF